MIQIRDLLISSKKPDLKNVGWVSFNKNTQKYELKFHINGRWLPIVSDIMEPEKIEKVEELIEWFNNNGTDLNKSLVNSIIWNNDTHPSNMNDFVVAGVYNIKGERTRDNDNLPIANTGSGHTFNARLTVLDSSIERTEGEPQSDDKCITQLLTFSNRLGQGEVYIRTGKGRTLDSLTWDAWSTLQRNVNVGKVGNLDAFVDNGIYSGMDMNRMHTFVLIVVNNYALASAIGVGNKTITQLKYAAHLNGTTSVETRTKFGNNDWSDWKNLGGSYTLPVATADTLGGIKSETSRPIGQDTSEGKKCDVYVDNEGKASVYVEYGSATRFGVVKVDGTVNPESNNPVSGKGVADAIATAITNTLNTAV